MSSVKLFGVWGCPFSTRVELALKLKGVDYEFIQEDLKNKSEELLKYNPITKQIPVFVYNGQPILESLLILEFIDEIWNENPLLPTDPYLRAQTRFWTKFIDEKIVSASSNALPMQLGEGNNNALSELVTHLETLENEMKTIKLLKESGNNKFLDIFGLYVVYWIPILQEFQGKDVLTKEKYPEICKWADEIFNCNTIKDNLPDREKMLVYLRNAS